MKDTLIVFIAIAVILGLPLVFLFIKALLAYRKNGKFKLFLRNSVIYLILLVVLIVFTINIYNFTLSYQAPLVAEDYLLSKGLKEFDLEGIGLDIYMSENSYEEDDGSLIIYSQLELEEGPIYTEIRLRPIANSWEVYEHKLIEGDLEDYPELKKRFYPIKR